MPARFDPRRRSIRASILAILSALTAGYLVLLALMQITAGSTHDHMERVSGQLFPAALWLAQSQAAFERSEKRYKDAVLLEDPAALADASLQADDSLRGLAQCRAALDSMPALAAQADTLLAQLTALRERSRAIYPAVLEARDLPSPALQAQVRDLAAANAGLTSALQGLSSALSSAVRMEISAVDASSLRRRNAAWLLMLCALAACAGAWVLLHHSLVRPLRALAARMQDIGHGQGDLTARLAVDGSTELDQVALHFNAFIERIEQVVLAATLNARTVADASTEIASTAQNAADQARLQCEQNARIGQSIAQISSAIQAISLSTRSAASDALAAERSAQSGGATIDATVDAIQQLVLQSNATAAKIEELGGASQAIGRIIHVIDDIAEQTSLLALNASIESARAGEHGRGFAVVASEVRRLAERTGNATREIDETIRAIQSGTRDVVHAMRNNLAQVQTGVASAQSAGQALEHIIEGSAALQKMVAAIAAASAEQSQATSSVTTDLQQITSTNEARVHKAGNVVHACNHLSTLATDLYNLVSAFKVRAADAAGGPARNRPGTGPASCSAPGLHPAGAGASSWL